MYNIMDSVLREYKEDKKHPKTKYGEPVIGIASNWEYYCPICETRVKSFVSRDNSHTKVDRFLFIPIGETEFMDKTISVRCKCGFSYDFVYNWVCDGSIEV
jgi:hypothetical protein